MRKVLLLFFGLLLLSGCADKVYVETGIHEPVGFLYGFWHGSIVIWSFIWSLFDNNVSIYAVYNSGKLYDLGFVLGLGTFLTITYSREVKNEKI